jgi:hypothetical protein
MHTISDLNLIEQIYQGYHQKNTNPYKADDSIISDDSESDITISIGAKGRLDYLKTTISYFKKAQESTKLKINYVICEHDSKQLLKDYCVTNNINYLFKDLKNTNTKNMFSRSLAFNIIAKNFDKSKNWLFHDSDLLVNHDFFLKIEDLLSRCNTWIQPYSNFSVLNLNKEDTVTIQNNKNCYNLDEQFLQKISHNLPGAVGGSLLISNKLFKDVGGYDDELFFGYAPEDALFWFKLECMFKSIEFHKNWCVHLGSACYPAQKQNKINMYHQWHVPLYNSNPDEKIMNQIKIQYFNSDHNSIKKIIELKKNLFKESKI